MTVKLTDNDVCDAIEFWLKEKVLRFAGTIRVNYVVRRKNSYVADVYDSGTNKPIKELPRQEDKPA